MECDGVVHARPVGGADEAGACPLSQLAMCTEDPGHARRTIAALQHGQTTHERGEGTTQTHYYACCCVFGNYNNRTAAANRSAASEPLEFHAPVDAHGGSDDLDHHRQHH